MISYTFHPNQGGIESSSETLACEFVRLGHEVIMLTHSPAAPGDATTFPFEVVRRPGAGELWRLLAWCEVCFHNNVSLRYAWPLVVARRPWVVAHHTWISRTDGTIGWQDLLKRFALGFATNAAVSQAIAAAIGHPAEIIGNAYRDDVFVELPDVARERDLVFVGRLVSDKGVDLLLEALVQLRGDGHRPNLTVVGDGPERPALEEQARVLGLAEQVDFVGKRAGMDLVRLLNAHRIMVIPSRWKEPFGIVALEGIACGCVVVGSAGGGLSDAIGTCGVTYPNGDAVALAGRLQDLLGDPGTRTSLQAGAAEHLSRFRPREVALANLAVMSTALRGGK